EKGGASRIFLRDLETGKDQILLQHATYPLTAPHLSPDARWISFQAVTSPTERRIFVAPVRDWHPPSEAEWVPITNGRTPDRNPAFSACSCVKCGIHFDISPKHGNALLVVCLAIARAVAPNSRNEFEGTWPYHAQG